MGRGWGPGFCTSTARRASTPSPLENPLIFTRGPFLGAGVPGSSKMAVACKSPLTGFVGDSLSSGPVAEELSRMPFDALVIKGRASGPVFLHIEDESVRVLDAAPLVGLSAEETAVKISSLLGESDSKVAAIGPAGEALVRFACISNGGRQAGRTGAGAVMGAKNLKAIAFKGNAIQAPPDPELAELIAKLEKAMQSGATAKYRGPGTVANLAKLNDAGALPAYNFRQYTFEGADSLSVENLDLRRSRESGSDMSREWEHVYSARGGRGKSRLEYESLFAFGPLCGIDDPDVVIQAAGLCDRLGIDTISMGGTIAWAMESFEQGRPHYRRHQRPGLALRERARASRRYRTDRPEGGCRGASVGGQPSSRVSHRRRLRVMGHARQGTRDARLSPWPA